MVASGDPPSLVVDSGVLHRSRLVDPRRLRSVMAHQPGLAAQAGAASASLHPASAALPAARLLRRPSAVSRLTASSAGQPATAGARIRGGSVASASAAGGASMHPAPRLTTLQAAPRPAAAVAVAALRPRVGTAGARRPAPAPARSATLSNLQQQKQPSPAQQGGNVRAGAADRPGSGRSDRRSVSSYSTHTAAASTRTGVGPVLGAVGASEAAKFHVPRTRAGAAAQRVAVIVALRPGSSMRSLPAARR